MRRPSPLPEELLGRIFTRAEAIGLGITDHRLRAADVHRLGRGIYRHSSTKASHDVETHDARGLTATEVGLLRALCGRSPNCRVSHVTAAKAYGLALLHHLQNSEVMHLSSASDTHRGAADPLIRVHRNRNAGETTWCYQSVPISSPGELFTEMAIYLSLAELVVLGDQLVRQPGRQAEGRRKPWCTVEELRRAIGQGKGRHHIGQAREAAQLVRVGADSPPETYLRLALREAGLPEPELQIRIDPKDPYSYPGDMGFRQFKIVIQYEGAYHFTPEQQARDQRRNAAFEQAGRTVVLVNRVDLQEGFATVIERIRGLIADNRT